VCAREAGGGGRQTAQLSAAGGLPAAARRRPPQQRLARGALEEGGANPRRALCAFSASATKAEALSQRCFAERKETRLRVAHTLLATSVTSASADSGVAAFGGVAMAGGGAETEGERAAEWGAVAQRLPRSSLSKQPTAIRAGGGACVE